MSELHLIRIPVRAPKLLRFAREKGILQPDDTFGYTLHAWLSDLFGKKAPKPFRYFERRQEILGYATQPAQALQESAQSTASPLAWEALDTEGLASKPMPSEWRPGLMFHAEVLVCPVSRKDDEEKDIFLRAVDRFGSAIPPRAAVYSQWFTQQWGNTVRVHDVQLQGLQARVRHLRRNRSGGDNRLQVVERPQALFTATIEVLDGEAFGRLLARGIGRHRAFGFGMILLGRAR